MTEHKQGCDALGGYGHGVGPCTCGAVAPVEAQAVPDQLIKFCCVDCLGCEKCGVTRPTPAAADQQEQLRELAGAIEQEFVRLEDLPAFIHRLQDEVRASRAAAQLVAASPAAAAGVPTAWDFCAAQKPGWATTLDWRKGWDACRAHVLAAPPVAPVGAPTDLGAMWDRFIALRSKNLGVQVKNLIGSAEAMRDDFINANRAQGCELATDATKQLREHSVHPAMSTSSVPTAAPLLSSRETDRSDLPRGPL